MKLCVTQRALTRQRSHGGIMVAALLVTAAATVGFAAWANIVSQRRQDIEQTQSGTQRRLAVESGRQIARHWAYWQRTTLNSGAAVTASQVIGGTTQIAGGLTVPAWTGFAMETTSFTTGINHCSPSANDSAYAVATQATLPYSVMDSYPEPTVSVSESTTLVATVHSRSPILSGDLLVIHTPTLATTLPVAAPQVTGNFDIVNGRACILTTTALPNITELRASAISIPPYVVPATNALQTYDPTTSDLVLPSNFPCPITTTGSITADYALDDLGRLNVIDSPNNPSNSFKTRITAGSSVTINSTADLSQSGINFVASTGILTLDLNQIGLPGVIINDNVAEIVITGKASAEVPSLPYSSVAICYIENAETTTRTLAKITCQNALNTRRLILGVKKIPRAADPQVPGAPVVISFPQSNTAPNWRFIMISENTPLTFEATGGPGIITLQGGIQTDGSITSTTGVGNAVKLVPETNPLRLDRLSPRRAWVETYLDYTNGSL